jgi:hypothetical protein
MNFGKNLFWIESILVDAVLSADSKYRMYFTEKSIFIGHSVEIPTHFYDLSRLIRVFSLFECVLHFFSYF